MDLLGQLLEHDHWATTQLLDLSDGLSDAQLDASFDVGYLTLRATFEHMIRAVEGWIALMTGQPAEANQDDRSVAALLDRHERSYANFAAIALRMRDEQRLDETFVDRFGVNQSYGIVTIMVILHNTEHRTEARHILARLGVPDVPEVDPGIWDYQRRGL